MNCKITSGGVLQIERKTAGYVNMKCPFRNDIATTPTSLLDCDQTCPHFQETPAGAATATKVTLTCSGAPGAVTMNVVTDSR